jgi:tetratricopeptide (TPR) repeat protein
LLGRLGEQGRNFLPLRFGQQRTRSGHRPSLGAADSAYLSSHTTHLLSFQAPVLGYATASNNLELIDQAGGGGADRLAKSLAAGRDGDAAALFPEFIVNLIGYEHLQAGDIKGAVEILTLNVMGYPNSPNAYDSVSDAYLADGQKDLALQNAKRAVELLANDTVDGEQRRNGIRESAEQKIKQLIPANP